MQISDEIIYRNPRELYEHVQNSYFNSDLSEEEEAFLKASIAAEGIQEALLIHKDFDVVISGHQRRRIALQLGMKEVPTRMVTCTPEEAVELLITSNLARRSGEDDLMRKARQIKCLYDAWVIKPGRKEKESVHGAHFNRHDVARCFNLNDSSIRRLLKLNYLITEFQKEVSRKNMGLLAGTKVAALNFQTQQELYSAYQVVGGKLNVKTIEKLMTKIGDAGVAKEIKRERKQRLLETKLDQLRRDLTWLFTEFLEGKNATQKKECKEILANYLDMMEIGEGTDGENNG